MRTEAEMDNFLSRIEARRSIRKFRQTPVARETLRELVRLAALSPSGANLQPLKFFTISEPSLCARFFTLTRWAGYLPDGAPKEGERPMAYLILLGDDEIRKNCELDAGIALGTIGIAAEAMGLSSCLIGALDREGVYQLLGLPRRYVIHAAVALGAAAMEAECCEMRDGDVRYFYEGERFFVPKRPLSEVLLGEK